MIRGGVGDGYGVGPAPRVPLSILAAGVGNPPPEAHSPLGGTHMITLTVTCRDGAERLAVEQAIAFVRQLHHLAATAPDGQVLAACEQAALTDGRALLRDTLAAAVQQRVAGAEQKGGPPASAPRRTPGAPRAGTAAPS